MKFIKPNDDQLIGFCAGGVCGIVYMLAVAERVIKKYRKDAKRAVELNNRLFDDVWLYLPLEVKQQYQEEIKFYNIALREDI